MFKKLQAKAGLNNKQIGMMFPDYSYTVINEWQSGAKVVPQSAINTLNDYINSKG